jgi:hypothetical protein
MVLAPDRKDPNKVRAPGEGERITVGTKGIRLDQDADAPGAPAAGRPPARPAAPPSPPPAGKAEPVTAQ